MPKSKPTQDLTLIEQILSISKEIDGAACALAELDALIKKLELSQIEVFRTIEGRSAKVVHLLAKLTTEQLPKASLAKLQTLERSSNSALLKIQMRMQNENRLFTSISNVLKTRHDTAKNSIGNIR